MKCEKIQNIKKFLEARLFFLITVLFHTIFYCKSHFPVNNIITFLFNINYDINFALYQLYSLKLKFEVISYFLFFNVSFCRM